MQNSILAYPRLNRVTQILLLMIAVSCFFCLSSPLFQVYTRIAIFLFGMYSVVILSGVPVSLDRLQTIHLLVLSMHCVVSLFFTGGGIGSVITIVFNIFLVQVINHCKMNRAAVRIIWLLFLLLFISCLFKCPDYFIIWDKDKDIRLFNPNTLAFLTVYSSMILTLFSRKNANGRKALKLFLACLTIYGILQYKSRGALLMYTSFLIFKYVIPMRWKRQKRFTVMFFLILITAGYLFPLVYVHLAEGHWETGIVLSKFLGKKGLFTGREQIWNSFYKAMSEKKINYLVGIGSHANIMLHGEANVNVHSAFLVVLMNFGIIGSFLYYIFFILQINKIYSCENITKRQIDLLYGAFSFLVLGVFETTSLWMPFVLFMSFLWGMSKSISKRQAVFFSENGREQYEG